MGPPPYALSISHFISSVGADAGFAAIVGLAILILLYFAQARETSSLRDRFSEAAEQVRQLELRVAQLSRPGAANAVAPAVAPRPAAAAAPVTSRPAVRTPLPVSAVPMAPAGVGAPALSAATRIVPSGDEGAISIRSGRAQVAAAAAGAGAAVATAGSDEAQGSGGGGVIAPPAPAAPPAPGGPSTAGPAPATAAGGATGRATGGTPPPARAGNGVANGTGQTRSPAAGQPRPAQAPGRPYRIAGDRPTGAPRRPLIEPSPPAGGSWARRGLMALLGLLLLGAIVAVLVLVTSNNGTSTRAQSSSAVSKTASTKKHRHNRTSALTPARVTVAVLNGTSTTNLAHDVSLRLTNAGYKPGTIATATDQTQTATTVGYLPGQRRAAQIVARSLNLGSAAIQPVTQTNQAVACPQSTGCPAEVVVTVGSDLASAASSTPAASSTTT